MFSHVNEQPMSVMKKAGLTETVGQENFCDHIDTALARAQEIEDSLWAAKQSKIRPALPGVLCYITKRLQ